MGSSDGFFLIFCSIQCPVVIAWGDKDPWEPIGLGKDYGKFDPVEDFIVLPNVGHCPQVSLSMSVRFLKHYFFSTKIT